MKNVRNSSCEHSQGVPKIFMAPMYRAHGAVIFALAQLSCYYYYYNKRHTRSQHLVLPVPLQHVACVALPTDLEDHLQKLHVISFLRLPFVHILKILQYICTSTLMKMEG